MTCFRPVQFRLLALYLFVALLYTACAEDTKKETSGIPIRGNVGEIIIVMDSTRWRGELGDTLRSVLAGEVPGLLQGEPYFKLIYIHPSAFNSFIQPYRNLVFLTTLQDNSAAGRRLKQYFSPQSIERINQDTTLYMFAKQNEFARGQEILYLFGKTDEQLINNLSKNKEKIRQHFTMIERKRLQRNFAASGQKDIAKQILDEQQFTFTIPKGFAIAKNDSNFVWLAKPGKEVTSYLFATYKPYRSQEVFEPVNIYAWRDSIGYNYMNNPKLENSYVATQEYVLPAFKQISFDGKFSVETRGLWKLKNNSRGGPFLSYTFVDESTGRLYYIEGFLYAPSIERKREMMRELEAILWSFQPAKTEAKPKPEAGKTNS